MPPHPSTPAAHAPALAVDFYFSFIRSHCHWTVQDILLGISHVSDSVEVNVMLLCPVLPFDRHFSFWFSDLILIGLCRLPPPSNPVRLYSDPGATNRPLLRSGGYDQSAPTGTLHRPDPAASRHATANHSRRSHAGPPIDPRHPPPSCLHDGPAVYITGLVLDCVGLTASDSSATSARAPLLHWSLGPRCPGAGAALAARVLVLTSSSARHPTPSVVAGLIPDSAATTPPSSGVPDLARDRLDHPLAAAIRLLYAAPPTWPVTDARLRKSRPVTSPLRQNKEKITLPQLQQAAAHIRRRWHLREGSRRPPLLLTGQEMASPLTDLPVHLLAEIFLRLLDPADLARASATCVTFRRLAADGSFLRTFRGLHAPLHLALLNLGGFHPALPPHPSAPTARALALFADFKFSFLPYHRQWIVRDVRAGRVLLSRKITKDGQPRVFPELAVCDPLHRRYVLLPPVPDNLAASVEHRLPHPFLAPLSEEEAAPAEETAFRVICLALGKTKLAAFAFPSSTGQWRDAASKDLSDLGLGMRDSHMISWMNPFNLRRHYAYGCFYWDFLVVKRNLLLVLDIRRMEFSIAELPPGEWYRKGVAIVEAGEGRLGMFGLRGENEMTSDLSYTILRNRGESPNQWLMEKTISLDSGYHYFIKAVTERCLLLMRTESLPGSPIEKPLLEYFTMDIETLQFQRVCAKRFKLRLPPSSIYAYFFQTGIYANFPPSLLPPRTV
ncbi:uncharacterized protein [Aegilops tauschii subsp. strangulata]|uniref:uncharacterized protein n=1 Tax=Aegilops tauschii subsp. strangulata TaxID=200361 RepID=UPI001ABC37E8|nr:uncharacterized protein LOC109761628 [Aegilops tauschii subsp. strangulata]